MHHQLPQILPGRHYLAYLTGGFLAGNFYAIYAENLTFVPLFGYLIYSAGFLLLILLPLFLLSYFVKGAKRDMILCWLICLFFILGIGRVYLFDLFKDRSLKATAGEEHSYTATLLETPVESSSGASLGASVLVACIEDGTPVSGKVLVYAKPDLWQSADRGDTVVFTTILKDSPRASFSGGFDYRLHLYRQGISYSVYTETLTRSDAVYPVHSLSYRLETLGRSIQNSAFFAIDQIFGKYPQEAALLKGILLGNRDSFTDAQNEDFTLSGFVHITSASGMHIMFLFGFFNFMLRRFRIPKWLIHLTAIPLLLVFGATVAFTPSICRAMMMLILVLLANHLQMEPDGLTSLSFAALVLAILNPYIITGYSFILSFGATLGIVVFYAPINRSLTRWNLPSVQPLRSLIAKTLASASLSLASTLGLGYFMARFFNRLSWGGILGNIPLVPLGSMSFVGGIFLWGCYYLYAPLAIWLAEFIRIPLWLMNRLAEFFSKKIFWLYVPTPPPSAFVLYLLFCGVIYYFLTYKKR